MEWQDQGIVIKVHPHGEGKALVTLFTQSHGKHLGFIRNSHKLASTLQLGTIVDCRWKARLSDQLGMWDLEGQRSLNPVILNDPLLLTSVLSMCSWSQLCLPEREAHPCLYDLSRQLLNKLANNGFIEEYVLYELGLLKDLGFGLDLEKCGATGLRENLTYVSPKSGRAINEIAATPYKDRLIELPQFLHIADLTVSTRDIIKGLNLTGYFLERHVLSQHNKAMPNPRQRLMTLLKRADR